MEEITDERTMDHHQLNTYNEWETVGLRKRNQDTNTTNTAKRRMDDSKMDNKGKRIKDNKDKRRPPKTVAIAIKGEEGFSYADALKKSENRNLIKGNRN